MDKITKNFEHDIAKLTINTEIYSIKAIINAAYNFNKDCYLYNEKISDSLIETRLKLKANSSLSLEKLSDEFCNELINQQIRLNIEKEYGHIRDLIFKKAFSPIDNEQNLNS